MADYSNLIDGNAAPIGNAEFFSPAYMERRRQAMEQAPGPEGMDDLDPKLPAGHAYAIRAATRLTSYTKRHQRKAAMDITPQDVVDVFVSADVKDWVLMGLLRRLHAQSTGDAGRRCDGSLLQSPSGAKSDRRALAPG